MKKVIKYIILFIVAGNLMFCNESRDIPTPVEQTRPTLKSFVEPVDSTFAFDRSAALRLRFDEPMNPATFDNNFFLWEDSTHTQAVAGSFKADGNDILFQPSAPLMKAHEYFTELRARVKDTQGNGIDKDPLVVSETEFVTDGDFSRNGVPDLIVSNGAEDFLAIVTLQNSHYQLNASASIAGFGRQLEMAFTPDGKWLLMSDYNSSNSGIYFLNPANYQIDQTLTDNSDGTLVKKSAEIVVTDSHAYVVNQTLKKISVVDLATKSISAVIDLPNTPKGMAILPDGSKIFVGSARTNEVWVVDPQTNLVTNTITVDAITRCIRLEATDDGKSIMVREFGGSHLAFINVATESVNFTVDLGFVSKSGNNNDLVAYGPYAYIPSNTGELLKINVSDGSVVARLMDDNFQGVDIYPSGEFILATVRRNPAQLVIINPDDLKILRRINIGGASPWDVAVRP